MALACATPYLPIEPLPFPQRNGFSPVCFTFANLNCSALSAMAATLHARSSNYEKPEVVRHTLDGHHQKCLASNRPSPPGEPETDVATYASLLQRCTTEKALSEGERVHEHITSRGYGDNMLLNNRLLQMYGKCGSLQHARAVFENMAHRNLCSWTTMLAACSQNGHAKEALKLFGQMQTVGFDPDKVTFICVLDACANMAAIEAGGQIHASIVASGCESDVVVGTALIIMYGKCRSLEDARAVFTDMPCRDVVSWNAMITMCSQNGHNKEALQLFGRMQAGGIQPNKITFICVLDACSSRAAIEEGREIHVSVVRNRCDSVVAVGTALLNMYGKCGSLDDARAVFLEMPHRDVVLWNSMISVCAQNGHGKEALHLFGQMQDEGFKPDMITCICILDACASIAALKEGLEIHGSVVANGCESVFLGNALVNMYGKCRSLDDARAVFAEMPLRDLVSWSAMVTVCAQNGQGREALKLFGQMQAEGFKPDKITFVCTLDACASMAALEEGREIHASAVGTRMEYDLSVGIALVNMYGKCGSLDDARVVFAEMPLKDVVLWSAMIAVCAQNGHGKEALQLFHSMQTTGFEADKVTFVSVLDACADVAALDEGREVHAYVIANAWESDVVVGNALINMYGKCGSLDNARAVFAEMQWRDVVTWSAMIAVCAQNGHGREALQLFDRMQAEGFKPDKITFICVLTACSHMGLVSDGRRYFTSMSQEHGILASMDHYLCMIDLLGRAGQLDKAEQLINSMPFEPVASAWLSLLSCCRIHGDVERGIRAAKHVFELDEHNALPYVLLARIHAVGGRSDDVEKMRKAIIEKDVKKVPGRSCIEMNNVAYEFVAGDTAHSQREHRYNVLHKLSRQMEDGRYVPDSDAVVGDLDEEHKKHKLGYNSTKLAVTFGLISTAPCTSICITKNFRVCYDCHSCIKFISKLVERKIIVRDANRFHHIEHGVCSCGEFC